MFSSKPLSRARQIAQKHRATSWKVQGPKLDSQYHKTQDKTKH